MIKSIVNFALRQRLTILVGTVLLLGLGIEAFVQVPIEAYPDVGETQVQVITQWPGHAAEEIERQVTIPIERVMNATPHQVTVRSVSIAGLGVVTVTFADRTDDYFARQQVLERLTHADLPPGVSPSLGPLASPIAEILRYQLVNCAERPVVECSTEDKAVEPRTLSELKDIEEWVLERELLRVDGVADVASFGGTVKQYQVSVDPARMAARGLNFADVERSLRQANGSSGGGVIAFGPAALNVRGVGLLRPDQIADVAMKEVDGTPIRIRDIGKVQVGYRPRMGRVSLDDDGDVVAATVRLRRGDDAQTVLENVHAQVRYLNAHVLPRGVKIHPYYDRSHLMKLTTHTVMENLGLGIAVIVIVLFVFLGTPRAALIVAMAIPFSLLTAFIGMWSLRIPANLLSIGAVDFGMIVDGAIVMVENILRLIEERQEHGQSTSPKELIGLVRGAAHQVARPMVFSISIVIASYLPIFTLQRVEGRLFRPMAWTVGFALIGALLAAVTLIPVIVTYALNGKFKGIRNPILETVRKHYLPAIDKMLVRPKIFFPIAAVLILAQGILFKVVGSEFLPHLNEGALWVRAAMPGNISLEEAEHLVDGFSTPQGHVRGIREILRTFPEVETMAVQLGRPDDGTDPTGFYNAEFLLALRDRSDWRAEFKGSRERLEEAMSHALSVMPGISFGFSQPISDNVEEALTGVKGQLAVKILGNDLYALDDLATRIAREIVHVPGVADLGVFRQVGQSNVHVDIRRFPAERVGVNASDIEDVVEAGIGGIPVTQIIEGERRHDLVVRYRSASRGTLDAIRRLPVPTDAGHVVPLAEVASVTVQGGASRIYREDGRRYIAIKFSVRGRDLGSTVAAAQAQVRKHVNTPSDYEVVWGGEFESAQRAGTRLSIVIPITVGLIFIILFAMFRRPHEAALILANVVMTAPVGALAALVVTGTNLSVSAGVGFLALFGVSVETGVMLVSYINEARATGVDTHEAIRQACNLRLRPMMMTALVATIGLVPAAVSHGIGSDSQKPLAIVVVGGLISSLALSLFTLPLLYKLFPGSAPRLAPPPLALEAQDQDEGALIEGSPR